MIHQKRKNSRKGMIGINKKHSFFNYTAEEILDKIIDILEKGTSINVLNPTRKREYTYVRAMYYRLAISFTRLSYEVIANKVNKDHASITHAMKNLWQEVETYRPDLVAIYEQIALDMNEDQYAQVKVYRMQKELNELEKRLKNIKEEINKDYFSSRDKLLNIKKAAYNVSSAFDIP